MTIEIKVPALGESVTEATVGQWFKKPGEAVNADEPLVELETDKVTVEVPAPVGWRAVRHQGGARHDGRRRQRAGLHQGRRRRSCAAGRARSEAEARGGRAQAGPAPATAIPAKGRHAARRLPPAR